MNAFKKNLIPRILPLVVAALLFFLNAWHASNTSVCSVAILQKYSCKTISKPVIKTADTDHTNAAPQIQTIYAFDGENLEILNFAGPELVSHYNATQKHPLLVVEDRCQFKLNLETPPPRS